MGRKKNGDTAEAPKLTPEQRLQAKRERFVRLAEKRVAKATTAIRNVGRLANRQAYSFYDSEAAQILAELDANVKAVRQAFSAENKERQGFRLTFGGAPTNGNGGKE